jgi:hypothetical protein
VVGTVLWTYLERANILLEDYFSSFAASSDPELAQFGLKSNSTFFETFFFYPLFLFCIRELSFKGQIAGCTYRL